MSKPIARDRLQPAQSQLPIDWYFSTAVFEQERERVFRTAPGYVGHERMVPAVGDYHTLSWMNHAKALVHAQDGVRLISNVCRHRQALLLEGRGNTSNIVCPLHRWTYDLDGSLLGAPQFDPSPARDLERTPLREWHGLLFAGDRDVAAELADFELAHEFDFSGYVFDHADVQDYPFNWKSFLEVYLELYHVDSVHPGVRQFVDPANYRWQFGTNWSNQVMGVYERMARPGTPAYARYQKQLLAFRGGSVPRYGTLWFIYFPNVMLEWYPEALVVSTLVPRSPTVTTNVVEFYYPEEVFHFERELIAAHQAAYLETATEDAMACERMDRGRRTLWEAGRDDRGPYQSPLEDGMIHFHEWLRRRLASE